MTTAAKGQKDKPLPPAPRLLPRPTAASTARAARNATNRNVTTPSVKQSPTRVPVYCPKGKNAVHSYLKSDSKTDIKGKNAVHSSLKSDSKTDMKAARALETDAFVIGNSSKIITGVVTSDKQDGATWKEKSEKEYSSRPYTPTTSSRPQTPAVPSRPHTPAMASRPETPRGQSSKPQTPHLSRPSTPAHPTQRLSTPSSCPNTPQQIDTPAHPRTPIINVPPSSRVLSPIPLSPTRSNIEEGDIQTMFSEKEKQFQFLKKELDLKQQTVLEAYDKLRELRERLVNENTAGCGEGTQLQELVFFNVADWTSEELSQLCRDAAASSTTDGAMELISNTQPIDECAFAELDSKVLNVPAHFADLCLEAFTARQEIIDWVKELIETNENGSGECLERVARYNTHGLELCESLRAMKSRSEETIDKITQLTRRAIRERGALLTVGESLVREIARLREDLNTYTNKLKELQESRNETDHSKDYEDMQRELEEERTSRIANKEKLASAESQLRQARVRISKMDRQLREAEASIAGLTGTVKSLEDQSRQKEAQLEARARKLKESLKTGEVTSNQLVQQRDALQAEIQDLKQQIETLNAQHKAATQEFNNRLKESKEYLEEQHKLSQNNIMQKAEAALAEAQNNIEALKTQITEMKNSKPNPDLPTEREMDLWAELQSTKETLHVTEDEVAACKREKIRFLETLTKITETENKVGMQQKLAAELLSKEEILGKMQIQIRELTKTIKLNEQKVIQYEQYVRDLHEHNRAIANCQESPDGISYQNLQQEIMTLRLGLLQSEHQNEDFAERLLQKEQQLEQQDKTSRAQARLIKVREELINMLKNKETEQSKELASLQQGLEHRMKIVDEVNKQIKAKADEIQELFSTLENKQQQIHRLEKIVLALEEQQRRSQAQRTRHEERIATLEHELAANGNRKERKFLFF